MKKKLLSDEGGQSALIIVGALFMLVVLAVSIIDVANITSTRIQTQNAADLSAYSGAVWQARVLNLISFLNMIIASLYIIMGIVFTIWIISCVLSAIPITAFLIPVCQFFSHPVTYNVIDCCSSGGTPHSNISKPYPTAMVIVKTCFDLAKCVEFVEDKVNTFAPYLYLFETYRIGKKNISETNNLLDLSESIAFSFSGDSFPPGTGIDKEGTGVWDIFSELLRSYELDKLHLDKLMSKSDDGNISFSNIQVKQKSESLIDKKTTVYAYKVWRRKLYCCPYHPESKTRNKGNKCRVRTGTRVTEFGSFPIYCNTPRNEHCDWEEYDKEPIYGWDLQGTPITGEWYCLSKNHQDDINGEVIEKKVYSWSFLEEEKTYYEGSKPGLNYYPVKIPPKQDDMTWHNDGDKQWTIRPISGYQNTTVHFEWVVRASTEKEKKIDTEDNSGGLWDEEFSDKGGQVIKEEVQSDIQDFNGEFFIEPPRPKKLVDDYSESLYIASVVVRNKPKTLLFPYTPSRYKKEEKLSFDNTNKLFINPSFSFAQAKPYSPKHEKNPKSVLLFIPDWEAKLTAFTAPTDIITKFDNLGYDSKQLINDVLNEFILH